MAARKGPSKGTGGHGRRGLQGKGPTPKAEERKGHPAQRRATAAAKRAAPDSRAAAKRAAPDSRAAAKRAAPDSRAAAAAAPRPRRSARGPAADEIVVGRNAVVEALRAGVPALALHLAVGLERDDRITEIRKRAADRGVSVRELPRHDLDRLAGGAPHQGVALVSPPYAYLHPDDLLRRALESTQPALIVALDGVTDPHNLGAIARSAAAFGAHGLLLAERRAAGVSPSAWKASAGALARLPVARGGNLVRTLTAYAEAGLMIAGLDGGGEIDLDALELADGPLVLVVGGEGRGLSRLVGETCDLTVRIPLTAEVESLNASVAAGIALAEVAGRRRATARIS